MTVTEELVVPYHCKNIIIIGDININILKSDSTTNKYLDVMVFNSFGFSLLINYDTRDISGTCLRSLVLNNRT